MRRLVILCAPCGAGKTATVQALAESGALPGYACLDTDQVGVNWWDYAGTNHEERFTDDCLAEAVRRARDRHILFGACISPVDFYARVTLPEGVDSTFYIGLVCSDEEIARRLKTRSADSGCTTDAFIAAQCAYAAWFRQNRGKFQLLIDSTGLSVSETAARVAAFLRRLDD